MTEQKTDYFGSFLDAMKSSPLAATLARALPSAEPSSSTGSADAVLRALLDHGGRAEVKDLLPLTAYSVDGLSTVLATLVSFGLVQQEHGKVMLTPEGEVAAMAKAAA